MIINAILNLDYALASHLITVNQSHVEQQVILADTTEFCPTAHMHRR